MYFLRALTLLIFYGLTRNLTQVPTKMYFFRKPPNCCSPRTNHFTLYHFLHLPPFTFWSEGKYWPVLKSILSRPGDTTPLRFLTSLPNRGCSQWTFTSHLALRNVNTGDVVRLVARLKDRTRPESGRQKGLWFLIIDTFTGRQMLPKFIC